MPSIPISACLITPLCTSRSSLMEAQASFSCTTPASHPCLNPLCLYHHLVGAAVNHLGTLCHFIKPASVVVGGCAWCQLGHVHWEAAAPGSIVHSPRLQFWGPLWYDSLPAFLTGPWPKVLFLPEVESPCARGFNDNALVLLAPSSGKGQNGIIS